MIVSNVPPLMRLFLVAVALATPVQAQSGRALIEQQFGAELQQVTATVERDDDRALAKKMYEAAVRSNNASFAIATAERIYEMLAADPRSAIIAADAMGLLAERSVSVDVKFDALTRQASLLQRAQSIMLGDEQTAATERLIEALLNMASLSADQAQWEPAMAYATQATQLAEQAGSSRTAAVQEAIDRLKVRRRIAALLQRRQQDPTDVAAADELLKLYLIELDDPAKAAEYQFTASDALLKQHVAAASRDLNTLNAAECLSLGDWYRQLLKQATPMARPAIAARARGYYERYLKLHTHEDAARQGAIAALGTLEDIVARLNAGSGADLIPDAPPATTPMPQPQTPTASTGPQQPPQPTSGGAPPVPAGDGMDLMANVAAMTDAGRGIWELADGQLKGNPPTPAQFTLPTAPSGDYQLTVQFTRTSSIGSVALHLPVGDQDRVLLVLGERRRRQRDYVAGLSTISDAPAEDNATTTPFDLKTGQAYTVVVEVKAAGFDTHISVSVDGKPLLSWTGNPSNLGVSKAWSRFEPKAFGLGIDGAGEVTFHSARLKSLSGKPPPPAALSRVSSSR